MEIFLKVQMNRSNRYYFLDFLAFDVFVYILFLVERDNLLLRPEHVGLMTPPEVLSFD